MTHQKIAYHQDKFRKCEHIVQVTAIKSKDLKGITSSDQTEAFLITSASGNRYLIVMEDGDVGQILPTAIKTRNKKHLLVEFIEIYNTVKKQASIQSYAKLIMNFQRN